MAGTQLGHHEGCSHWIHRCSRCCIVLGRSGSFALASRSDYRPCSWLSLLQFLEIFPPESDSEADRGSLCQHTFLCARNSEETARHSRGTGTIILSRYILFSSGDLVCSHSCRDSNPRCILTTRIHQQKARPLYHITWAGPPPIPVELSLGCRPQLHMQDGRQ